MKIKLVDCGSAKTQVIKHLVESLNKSLEEAAGIVDSCPVIIEVKDEEKGSEILSDLQRLGCNAGEEKKSSKHEYQVEDEVSWHADMDVHEMQKFFTKHRKKLEKIDELKTARKANKKPKEMEKPTPGAMLGCSVIGAPLIGAFIGFIAKWLFDISPITFWIIGGVVMAVILWAGIEVFIDEKKKKPAYEQYLYDLEAWQARDDDYKNKIDLVSKGMPSYKELRGTIFEGINKKLMLPFDEKWITKKNYLEIMDDLLSMLVLNEKSQKENGSQRRRLLMALSNEKLKFFYRYSLKGECGDDDQAYKPFNDEYLTASKRESVRLLRTDNEETQIVKGIQTRTDLNIQKCKELLDDNRMEPILAQLNDVKNADTSVLGLGLFTSTDKLAAKTKSFQDLCKAAKLEYDELANINEQLNVLLVNVRLKAYKNIYLCVDLVNFIRANAGGNKLTTQKDSVKMEQVELNSVAVGATDFNMSIGDNVGNTLGNITNRLMDNKSLLNFAIKNPKMAAGAAAIEVAQNLLKERNETIEKNNQLQAKILKNIEQIVDSYNYGKGEMMRVIEIIKAIAKANKGVVSIYSELRDKYFTENPAPVSQMEMMKDLQDLAKATQEYKHISDSKL